MPPMLQDFRSACRPDILSSARSIVIARNQNVCLLSTTSLFRQDLETTSTNSTSLDSALIGRESTASAESLIQGSRRRRAALQSSQNIPFEQLPFQCFQEARKVLQEDRKDKLAQIETQRARIERLRAQDPSISGNDRMKRNRLRSMQDHLEDLKIKADINDPLVKKRFEDDQGDMTRPIYRHLADRKWRARRRPIIMQRITQMHVVPDVVPTIDPKLDLQLYFGRTSIQPGEIVPSRISQVIPKLAVQSFERGDKVVTIAIIDSDVPDIENDNFLHRCHFLAVNIPISPASSNVTLATLNSTSQTIHEWLPPYAQKGAPYHRLSIFVLEQNNGKKLDAQVIRDQLTSRQNFSLRKFLGSHPVRPTGVFMFRSLWDEHTDVLMEKLGVQGADVELKHKRVEPLPFKKKPSYGERFR